MTKPFQRLRRFLSELKRRNVVQVAATYAVVGFVLIQVADLTFVRLGLPSWTVTFVIVLVATGFPLALVLAWAFERTPKGVRRTSDDETPEAGAVERTGAGYRVLVGFGLVAAAVAGGWYLIGGGGRENSEIGDRSVAVLPFESLGREQAGTFAEGMHSTLQTKLSNIADLAVTSSRAVERYRGSEESTAALARELGVAWVVSGDVQRLGDRIQVNVRLLDPDTDTQVWTDSYRRDLTAENLFAIQTDVTREVARALQAELSPDERERVGRRSTGDLSAYRLYVQGRQNLNLRTGESLRRAVRHFRRAIRQDSGYAQAWAGLADARGLYPIYATGSLDDSIPGQEEAARRALALDPELAEAHASMGYIYLERRNGPAALRKLERAVELKPSYAQAHHWLGLLMLNVGRLDQALQHLRLAASLDPTHTGAQGILFRALVASGRADEAEPHLRRVEENIGRARDQFRQALDFSRAILYYHSEQWEELQAFIREQREETPEEASAGSWNAFFRALYGVRNADSAAARSLLADAPAEYHLTRSVVHAALGEEEAALAELNRMDFEGQQLSTLVVRYYFPDILGPLRTDPRYREFIGRMNRAWVLNPDGSIPDSVQVSLDAAPGG